MKRHVTTIALAGAVLAAATHAQPANATDRLADPDAGTVDIIDNEIEDGIYDGTISYRGTLLVPAGATEGVVIRASIGGEAQLTAVDGEVGGMWSYDGAGSGSFQATGLDATADIDFTGAGAFEGSSTQARVVGNTMFSGIITTQGTSLPFGGEAPTDEVITDLLAGCGQVVGTYTQRINSSIEEQGAQSNIRGVIALYNNPPTSDAVLLAERASELRADPDVDAFTRLFAATGLLREVQEFQAELNATSTCPSAKEYFNLLTNVAADLIAEALAALEALEADDPIQAGIVAPGVIGVLVTMGVSTGATGSGAVGGRGAELLPALRERAQAAVDHNLESSFDFDLLTELAVLSVQNGWDLTFDQVTDRDVLLTAGVDPDEASGEEGE